MKVSLHKHMSNVFVLHQKCEGVSLGVTEVRVERGCALRV